jgi:outer membrane protein OmpA-like peptidoglycan-associated protein
MHKWLGMFALGCAATLTTGCQTTDPYTREKKTSNASTLAVSEGVKCGTLALVSGALSGSNRAVEDAAIKTGVCAGNGALAGAALDEQERRLLAELEAAGVKIAIRQQNEVLEIESPIVFASNSSKLEGSSYRKVIAIGKVLAKYNRKPVVIIGHTSPEEPNFIGDRRATAVRDTIWKFARSVSVATKSQGSSQPLGDNASQTGRDRNRRVSVFIRLASGHPQSS